MGTLVAAPGLTDSVAVAHGLSCSAASLPRSGMESMSPALADKFFTTEP